MFRLLKYSISGFITLAILLMPTISNAIENGTSALGDSRVIQIYTNVTSDNGTRIWVGGCSAWLYSPRIVLTNAHCVHDNQQKPNVVQLNPKFISVGKPGTRESNEGVLVSVVAIFAPKTFKWYLAEPGGTLSFTDDFAAIVLEKDLANVKAAKLATKELLDQMVTNQSTVLTSGYGFQSSNRSYGQHREPKFAKFPMITFEEGMKKVNEYKSKWNRIYFQENVYFMRVGNAGASPCDGDSGSGYYIEENSVYTYLGAMTSPIGVSNCGMQTADLDAVASFRPVFLDKSYIDLAESYVKLYPYKNINSRTIARCYSGKKIIYLKNVKLKCPLGFQKKIIIV